MQPHVTSTGASHLGWESLLFGVGSDREGAWSRKIRETAESTKLGSADAWFETSMVSRESGTPAIPECPVGSRSGISLGSGRDVSDVLDPSADLALEHALQLGQAQRPITSECPVVLLTLVDGDHSEPITEFAIADSLDRLEHAQMAWGEYGSGRGPNSRGPRRHYRLAAPPRQISNSHHASHCLPLSVPAVNS